MSRHATRTDETAPAGRERGGDAERLAGGALHRPANDGHAFELHGPDHVEEPDVAGLPETVEAENISPTLKFVLEMGPLLVFFFANVWAERLADTFPALAALGGSIFIATAFFMVATLLALSVSYALTRTLPIMPLVSGVVVLVFGALTLWLQDDFFIKIKPTIVNVLFGTVLLAGLAFGRLFLRIVLGAAFEMDEEGWRKLTVRWAVFFFFLAVLNEVVWRTQSNDFWLAFKVWGMMPITLAFTLSQMPLIMRHSPELRDKL